MSIRFFLLPLLGMLLLAQAAWGQEFIPERRRSPFHTEPSHFVAPAPYSLPGLGQGWVVVGYANNLFDSYTDGFLFALTGDIQGFGFGVLDYHLIEEKLILDLNYEKLDKVGVDAYQTRGMEGGQKDYNHVLMDLVDFFGGRLTWTNFERRLDVTLFRYDNAGRAAEIRDADGNLLVALNNPPKVNNRVEGLNFWLDLTDDYQDPRLGVRFQTAAFHRLPQKTADLESVVWDFNLTGYLPVGGVSTLALNAFQSSAQVLRQGLTDPAQVEAEMGLNCAAIPDPAAQAVCIQQRDQTILANQNGTATSLGGISRLRGFPEMRFHGAHAQFAAVEWRINFSDEPEPFNFIIVRDVKVNFQVALFAETGTVAETRSDLWKQSRNSYGAGFRVVGGSGMVYRADIGVSDEGPAFTIIVGYPWESF